MKITIEKCTAWCGNLRTSQDWQQWAQGQLSHVNDDDLPALKQVPAMQRRRLSRFAKLTMQCVLDIVADEKDDLSCVFSSRHGDLHKTSKLIEDVAEKSDLSPTHFGLSVHNAVAGLYSVFSKNKQPMTAISAGEDSFLMAIVDGYAKLESQKSDKVLIVYTDEIVPDKYSQYVSADEQTISIALILQRNENENSLTIDCKPQKNAEVTMIFQPLKFLSFWYGSDTHVDIDSARYQWQLSK